MISRALRGQERWAVFISGRGSNLQALLDNFEENRIALVVSSSPRAPGLLKARRLGIPTLIIDKTLKWEELNGELRKRRVRRIFLAGFMRLIPESFVKSWENCILNVHPSLLPAFPGLKALEQNFVQARDMGVTVHVVTPEMDAGPRLLKKMAVCGEKILQESLTLSDAEFLISITEQTLVREAFRRWN